MGRPKLYKTTEELREAKRMHRQAYYARNKNAISTKMKARYRAQASASSTINSDHSFPDQKHARKKNRLLTYLGASPRETLDAMYTDFLETRCSDNIRDVMGIIQEILRELKEIEEDIARARVTGRRYINAQDESKQAAEVLSALQDLFSCVMVQDMDLRLQYEHKRFLFQSL